MNPPLPLVPSERASPEELRAQVAKISESPIVTALLEAADAVLLVLNSQRQVLAANRRHRLAASLMAAESVLGLRSGEALACIEARKHPDGCGAAEACRSCGALRAILTCQREGRPSEGELLLSTEEQGVGKTQEFAIRATPVCLNDQRVTVVSLRDISGEKRRQALEHVFFHDLLNTVAGMAGWSERLRLAGDADWRRPAQRLVHLVKQLEREIHDQRALVMAESRTLSLSLEPVRASTVFANLRALFASHSLARDRHLEFQEPDPELEVKTDASLLLRVANNMLTNALEATAAGGTVRIWSERQGRAGATSWVLSVHNGAVIPPLVACRIFQRSFSTKSERGRGLGTYSMKLLGEGYLGGRVSFTSQEGQGTTFCLELPLG